MYGLDQIYAQMTVKQKYEHVLRDQALEFYPSIVVQFNKLGLPEAHASALAFKLAVVASETSYDEYVRDFRVCRVDDEEALLAYEENRDIQYCVHEEYVTLDSITYQIGCSWGD